MCRPHLRAGRDDAGWLWIASPLVAKLLVQPNLTLQTVPEFSDPEIKDSREMQLILPLMTIFTLASSLLGCTQSGPCPTESAPVREKINDAQSPGLEPHPGRPAAFLTTSQAPRPARGTLPPVGQQLPRCRVTTCCQLMGPALRKVPLEGVAELRANRPVVTCLRPGRSCFPPAMGPGPARGLPPLPQLSA